MEGCTEESWLQARGVVEEEILRERVATHTKHKSPTPGR
jgi:hypothetical protein